MRNRSVNKSTSDNKAFTLVELLVVISLISLLMALILPAIGQARYQAKVATCAAQLKGMGHAVTAYAVDFRMRYPTAAPPPDEANLAGHNWFYTVWDRSWTWSGQGQSILPAPLAGYRYNLRPVYREYLGGSLNTHARCPLASPLYHDVDMDTFHMSNYMLYMTNNRFNKLMSFHDDGTDYVSSKVGHAWSPSGRPDHKFTLLASDAAFHDLWGTNGSAVTGHPDFQGSDEHPSVINTHTGYLLGRPGTKTSAPLNFLDGDGSVHTYKFTPDSIDDTENWIQWGNREALLPVDLAK